VCKRKKERKAQRKEKRQSDRETERQRDRETEGDGFTYKTYIQPSTQTEKLTGRQTRRERERECREREQEKEGIRKAERVGSVFTSIDWVFLTNLY